MGGDLYPLVLVLLLALAVPLLLHRAHWLQIPVVVGELVAGTLFGRTGLGLIPENALLSFLSLFGLSYLMFLSGLELDLDVLVLRVRDQRKHLAVSAGVYLGVLTLSVLVGMVLQGLRLVHDGLLTGFIIGSTALTVVVPVLKERGILRTEFGQSVLASAILLDFLSMLLVTVGVSVLKGAAFRLVLGVGIFLAAAVLMRFAPHLRFLWRRAESQVAQVGVRGAFGLIVLFLALSQLIGIQAVLGSFLAGVIATAIAGRESDELRKTLDGIGYGFFIPVFFIQVGAGLNLRQFLGDQHSLVLAAALFILASVASLLPGMLLRFLLPWRSALAGALLLSTRLTVTIAGATVAAQAHAITTSTMTAIVLMSIVSSLVWPSLAKHLMPMPPAERRGVLVFGGSPWAPLAAAHLRERGEQVIWLGDEENPPAGVRVVRARASDGPEEILRRSEAAHAAVLLALGEDEEANARLCRSAQDKFAVPRTVALATPDQAELLRAEGIGCFLPESAPLVVLEAMARAPLALEMLSEGVAGAQLYSFRVRGSQVDGLLLRELDLPREVLLIALERGGQRILPRGDTRLAVGDRVTALGTPQQIARVYELLADSSASAPRLGPDAPGGLLRP